MNGCYFGDIFIQKQISNSYLHCHTFLCIISTLATYSSAEAITLVVLIVLSIHDHKSDNEHLNLFPVFFFKQETDLSTILVNSDKTGQISKRSSMKIFPVQTLVFEIQNKKEPA